MKGRQIRYTAEELAFIQSVAQWRRIDALKAFSQRFARDDVNLSNFNALCKRKGWMTGRDGRMNKGNVPHNKGKKCAPGTGGLHPNARATQFKKGQVPHNTNYLGHERVSQDGYVEISVAETNPHTGYERRYVLKHRHLWEQTNGPLPEGYALKCLSSDRTNCDPANWELVPRAILPRLAGGNRFNRRLAFDEAPDELKPTIMVVARVEHAVREARKATPTPHKERSE